MRGGAIVLGLAVFVGGVTACNPAIYRAKGSVRSSSVRADDAEICLVGAVKAKGSTYGEPPAGGQICMSGVPEPEAVEIPNVGECVILQNQGEGSSLKIERATDCPR